MSASVDSLDYDGDFDELNDEDEWECAYPDKCLMPSPLHQRNECYTVEDLEEYYREMETQQLPLRKE